MKPTFTIQMQVRDYECDLQGIVNNAVYQNYLEFARHEYLKSKGINFVELHKNGIDAVLVKSELEYKQSLLPDDVFEIKMRVVKEGYLRIVFYQYIYRLKDNKLCLKAKASCVLVEGGKVILPSLFHFLDSEADSF